MSWGLKIAAIALAGALGTLARYGLAGGAQRWAGGVFPWGTLSVNLVGSLLAGLFWGLAENRVSLTGEIRAIVLVGFMGGFTTFSAFMLETSGLLRDAQWGWAVGNLLLQNFGGLACFLAGRTLGQWI
jgi:CrcB protein